MDRMMADPSDSANAASGSSATSFLKIMPTVSRQQPPQAASLRERPTNFDMKLCKWWKEGYCIRGDSCWYRHGFLEGEQETSTSASGSRARNSALTARATAFEPRATNRNSDIASECDEPFQPTNPATEEQPQCSICFELPAIYGLLENCDHSFCLTCIRSWRDNKEKDPDLIAGQVNKACPACRQRSNYVTPSSQFHLNGRGKEAVVERYKSILASKPCKFFEKSKLRASQGLWCPFGDDCHYRHVLTEGDDRYTFGKGADEMFREQDLRRMAREHTLSGMGALDLLLRQRLPRRRGMRYGRAGRRNAIEASLYFDFDAATLLDSLDIVNAESLLAVSLWDYATEHMFHGVDEGSLFYWRDWSYVPHGEDMGLPRREVLPTSEDCGLDYYDVDDAYESETRDDPCDVYLHEGWESDVSNASVNFYTRTSNWIGEDKATAMLEWLKQAWGRAMAKRIMRSFASSDPHRVHAAGLKIMSWNHRPCELVKFRPGCDVDEYRQQVYDTLCQNHILRAQDFGAWERQPAVGTGGPGLSSGSQASSAVTQRSTRSAAEGASAADPSSPKSLGSARSQRRLAQRRHRRNEERGEEREALPALHSNPIGSDTSVFLEGD